MPNNNSEPSFFFLDYETFGVNPAIDKPCQFAGIRTDKDFNIIGDPINIVCKIPSDYLPQPQACLITGITPQMTLKNGLLEAEFFKQIATELNQPNTCIIGYNNIRFDDEVTRYGFYRNFIDPYEWSYKNNNSRWDIIDLLRTCYALRPDGIKWVFDDNNLAMFKLDRLTIANEIEHANAHDALADVYATIEMTKLIKKAQPRLFKYMFNLRHKRNVEKLVNLIKLTPLVHISSYFGKNNSNTSIIVPIAWHPKNKNALICIDLNKDITPLLELDVENIKKRLYTKNSLLAEDELPIGIKLVHINRSPSLSPISVLGTKEALRINLDKEKCLTRLENVKQNQVVLKEKLTSVYQEDAAYPTAKNVDAMLYDGFFSYSDKENCKIIANKTPKDLPALELEFTDPRIAKLLFQYKARNYPQILDEKEQQTWFEMRKNYFSNNLLSYTSELDKLYFEFQDDPLKVKILKELYAYINEI